MLYRGINDCRGSPNIEVDTYRRSQKLLALYLYTQSTSNTVSILHKRVIIRIVINEEKEQHMTSVSYQSSVFTSGMLDSVTLSGLLSMVMLNVAFKSDSSKDGNTDLASCGHISVAMMYL